MFHTHTILPSIHFVFVLTWNNYNSQYQSRDSYLNCHVSLGGGGGERERERERRERETGAGWGGGSKLSRSYREGEKERGI